MKETIEKLYVIKDLNLAGYYDEESGEFGHVFDATRYKSRAKAEKGIKSAFAERNYPLDDGCVLEIIEIFMSY